MMRVQELWLVDLRMAIRLSETNTELSTVRMAESDLRTQDTWGSTTVKGLAVVPGSISTFSGERKTSEMKPYRNDRNKNR